MKYFKLLIAAAFLCCSLTAISGDHSFGRKKNEISAKAIRDNWGMKADLSVRENASQANKNLFYANPRTVTAYQWSGSGWDFVDTMYYTYNSNGDVTEVLYVDMQGQYLKRETYVFNNEGVRISDKFDNFENGQWVDFYWYKREVDADQRLLTNMQMLWNGSSWDTLYYVRNSYTKDVVNSTLEQIQQLYGGNGQWENSYRGIMTYANGSEQPVEGVFYDWNGTEWTERDKVTDVVWHYYSITYNSGQMEFCNTHEWNGTAWDTSGRETGQFDVYGGWSRLGEVYNSGWTNDWREIRIHNLQHDFVNQKYEIWNGSSWQKLFDLSAENTYDQDDRLTERNYKQGTTYTSRYVYADFTSGVEALSSKEITLFPNPGKDKFKISSTAAIKSVQVYNLVGERIYSTDMNAASGEIDLSGYPAGSYIVRINTDKKSYTQKLMLQ